MAEDAEPRLGQARLYEEADLDGMNQKQLRAAAKELGVNQKQLTPALREACKRAVRAQRQEEVALANVPGSSSAPSGQQVFDGMNREELRVAAKALGVNQ